MNQNRRMMRMVATVRKSSMSFCMKLTLTRLSKETRGIALRLSSQDPTLSITWSCQAFTYWVVVWSAYLLSCFVVVRPSHVLENFLSYKSYSLVLLSFLRGCTDALAKDGARRKAFCT